MSSAGQARHAKRTDGNQTAIRRCLEQMHACVWVIGVPCDLLVGYRGAWCTMEVKDGRKPPSARKLTEDEARFAAQCLAMDLPHYLVLDEQGARDVLDNFRRRGGAFGN